MTQTTQDPTTEDFDEVAARYRRELVAHCYRMTGSVYEAEDMVQETYLRAWKAYHSFEGRSSVRTWRLFRRSADMLFSITVTRPERSMRAEAHRLPDSAA